MDFFHDRNSMETNLSINVQSGVLWNFHVLLYMFFVIFDSQISSLKLHICVIKLYVTTGKE